MEEASLIEPVHNALDNGGVLDKAGRNQVAALYDLVATDLYQCDCFGVTRLEAHGGAGGDVEAVAVGADAVEL